MQLIKQTTTLDTTTYVISIIPRYFDYDVFGVIRCKMDNTTSEHEFTCEIGNGVMHLNLGDFVPEPEVKYELTLNGRTGGYMWFGQMMLTNKDIINYQLNATTENNLKF